MKKKVIYFTSISIDNVFLNDHSTSIDVVVVIVVYECIDSLNVKLPFMLVFVYSWKSLNICWPLICMNDRRRLVVAVDRLNLLLLIVLDSNIPFMQTCCCTVSWKIWKMVDLYVFAWWQHLPLFVNVPRWGDLFDLTVLAIVENCWYFMMAVVSLFELPIRRNFIVKRALINHEYTFDLLIPSPCLNFIVNKKLISSTWLIFKHFNWLDY